METSKTLIRQMAVKGNEDAWFEFVSTYSPIIKSWLCRSSVAESDHGDIVQDVLVTLARKLGDFDHNGRLGAFRRWLKIITINRCLKYFEQQRSLRSVVGTDTAYALLDQLENPSAELNDFWNQDYQSALFQQLLDSVREDFSERTISVFIATQCKHQKPKVVAKQFEMSVAQVYKVRFRVLAKLRKKAEYLMASASRKGAAA